MSYAEYKSNNIKLLQNVQHKIFYHLNFSEWLRKRKSKYFEQRHFCHYDIIEDYQSLFNEGCFLIPILLKNVQFSSIKFMKHNIEKKTFFLEFQYKKNETA